MHRYIPRDRDQQMQNHNTSHKVAEGGIQLQTTLIREVFGKNTSEITHN